MQMQLVSASGTQVNTTIVALTAVSGDTLVVPTFEQSKKAWILQLWADVQLAGTLRIRAPQMHDNVNGIRIDTIASDVTPLLPWGVPSRIFPGQQLNVELAGSSTSGDVDFVTMLQAFEELPGQQGRYLRPEDVMSRMVHLCTVENTITTGTAGIWSGSEGINAEIDQFQTEFDYAILGYKTDTECQAIGLRAPAWANTRIGGPGIETEPWLTSDWFLRISRTYNMPLVPYFAGPDKASVLVDALIDENGADPTFTLYLAAMRRG